MLDRNQETRIKAQDILNHRWITGEQTKEEEEEEKVESKEKEIKNFKSSATLSNTSSKKQTNSNNKKPTKVEFLPFKIHKPPQEFCFFYNYFVAMASLIPNQQSKIIYLLRVMRYFTFNDGFWNINIQDENFEFDF